MNEYLQKAKEIMEKNNYTCVVLNEKEIYTSNFRGVKPLLKWIDGNANFDGYYAADRVIGKATAFLYCLLNVSAVYACVISKPAIKVLKDFGIEVEFSVLVENIVNRKHDGPCPFEEAVKGAETKEEALEIIRAKTLQMGI